jgi:hypothetical protein
MQQQLLWLQTWLHGPLTQCGLLQVPRELLLLLPVLLLPACRTWPTQPLLVGCPQHCCCCSAQHLEQD